MRSQGFIKGDALQALSLSTHEYRRISAVLTQAMTPLVVGLGSVRAATDQLIDQLPPR